MMTSRNSSTAWHFPEPVHAGLEEALLMLVVACKKSKE